jgi:hypothetical protein
MMSAYPIWSRGLPARLAAGVARMCGRIGSRLKLMPDRAGLGDDRGWKHTLDDPMLVEDVRFALKTT